MTVSGSNWEDDTVIMTWFEAKDPDIPDMFIGGSCTTKFNKDEGYSTWARVKTTYSEFSYRDVGNNVMWSDVLADSEVHEESPTGTWSFFDYNRGFYYDTTYE